MLSGNELFEIYTEGRKMHKQCSSLSCFLMWLPLSTHIVTLQNVGADMNDDVVVSVASRVYKNSYDVI